MRTRHTIVVSLSALALLAASSVALGAKQASPFRTFERVGSIRPTGASLHQEGVINSDLAFWGDKAYEGTYDGFRIIDISRPASPQEILDYDQCNGNQGDVIVWDDILVRSWNSAATTQTCDGVRMLPGTEGVHVFDVSIPADPQLEAFVPTLCGSHTATGVPDVENGRLLIYNNASSATCPWLDIIEVPLDDPASARLVNIAPSGRSCHDTGVILGEEMLAACAGGNGFTVFSIGDSPERSGTEGTLEAPRQLFSVSISGVSIGHSAAFSWDGEVLVFGHEPGGGTQARCEESDSDLDRTLFFFDTDDATDDGTAAGTELGRWILTDFQTSTENCTIHNYNIVPTARRDILVSGNYQAGIRVVDFTDPASAFEVASADPAPLSATQLITGGDWSSYWYNGRIYESDITRGLLIWNLGKERAVDGALRLEHLNPQTQETTLG